MADKKITARYIGSAAYFEESPGRVIPNGEPFETTPERLKALQNQGRHVEAIEPAKADAPKPSKENK